MVGLTAQALAELDGDERAVLLKAAADRLRDAGADLVIDTVADLIPALEAEATWRAAFPNAPEYRR